MQYARRNRSAQWQYGENFCFLLDEGLVEEVERIRRRHRHRQYIIRSTQLLISLNGPSIKLRVGICARHRNCNEFAERVCESGRFENHNFITISTNIARKDGKTRRSQLHVC